MMKMIMDSINLILVLMKFKILLSLIHKELKKIKDQRKRSLRSLLLSYWSRLQNKRIWQELMEEKQNLRFEDLALNTIEIVWRIAKNSELQLMMNLM